MKRNVSQKGNDNIAIIDSNVEILEPLDKIQKLLANGEIEEAASLFSIVVKGGSAQHPLHPHWRYSITADSYGKTAIGHVPNSPQALEMYPLRGSMKVAIPEKYRTFSNFNELLKHSYQKQEEIELDAEYFKAWIGDFLIHQMDSSKYSEIKVIMKPEEFPKPFKAKLLLDKSISIDYLEIGLKEIRENSFVLDNSKQTNSKILVTFIVDIIKNRGEFSLSINEKYKNDVKANLNIRKFLLAMQHNQSLTLKNLVSEKILFQTKTINLNEKLEEGIQKNIEILDILSSIEDFFDIIFTLPKRAFTQEEYEIIELLNFALKNKKRNRDCTEFSMTVDNKETIKNILNAFNQENPTHNLTLKKENEQLILLDQPIIIKEYIIELNNIKLKDRDVLMKKVEYFENGESIKVVFVPEKKSLIVESFIL